MLRPSATASSAKRTIEQLPIRTIDFTSPADVTRHDQVVTLVERILDLHRKLAAEAVPHARTVLQRQIDATDRQIDARVLRLYRKPIPIDAQDVP